MTRVKGSRLFLILAKTYFMLFQATARPLHPSGTRLDKNTQTKVNSSQNSVIINVPGDLVIAKVDSTKNEIDGIDIEGFPTIKMFKKETNEEIEYVGKRCHRFSFLGLTLVFFSSKCLCRKERFGVNGEVH